LAFVAVCGAATVYGVGVFRIELDRLAEVLNGAVSFAPNAMSNAATVKGSGLVRIEFDGLVVVLDGAVKVALGSVGGAAIDEGPSQTFALPAFRLDYSGAGADLYVPIDPWFSRAVLRLRQRRTGEAGRGHERNSAR
jgi:hypothetical protein